MECVRLHLGQLRQIKVGDIASGYGFQAHEFHDPDFGNALGIEHLEYGCKFLRTLRLNLGRERNVCFGSKIKRPRHLTRAFRSRIVIKA